MVTPATYLPRLALPILAAVLSACSAGPSRPDATEGTVQTEVAREVHRICSLPEAQREAEIRTVKEQSGVVIGCRQHE
jgi:hypothetical protein